MHDDLSVVKQKNDKMLVHEQVETVPSSFKINPQYFNRRLVRIKGKIDLLIKQHVSTQYQSFRTQMKTQYVDDDKRASYQTVQTNSTAYSKARQVIAVEKIVGETKDKIQSIYNQIHLLETIAVKDQNNIDTNTFQLRSFLKDLRNQNKRLNKIIPESVLFQIEQDKKQTFKKSQIMFKQNNNNSFSLENQAKLNQKEQLQKAKKMIQEQFSKRKIFNDSQKYYGDKANEQNSRCILFSCSII